MTRFAFALCVIVIVGVTIVFLPTASADREQPRVRQYQGFCAGESMYLVDTNSGQLFRLYRKADNTWEWRTFADGPQRN